MPIRLIFWIIFGAVIVRAMRSEKTFENCLLFSVVGFVTYVIWASGVHDNYLFVAVILAYLLMLHERTREHWAIATILAVMLNINMFVFYGVTRTQLQSRVVGVDVSVILAMLYAIAWLLWHCTHAGCGSPKSRASARKGKHICQQRAHKRQPSSQPCHGNERSARKCDNEIAKILSASVRICIARGT